MSEVILVRQYPCQQGAFLGRISLNNQRAINALTQDMIDAMQVALDEFALRDDIVAVMIDGEGEKGFCAGGDIRAMYQSAQRHLGGPALEAEVFFEREYRLNYTLHTYPKPLIAFGHGVLMGGGMGIYEPCRYRVVTPSTRIAMPEIAIALYPDVAASYFMPKWPQGSGYFLALTGASINARDALDLGLAHWAVAEGSQRDVIDRLTANLTTEGVDDTIERVLQGQSLRHDLLPEPQIAPHLPWLAEAMAAEDLASILTAIEANAGRDAWLANAVQLMKAGSPLSIVWTYQQLKRCEARSIEDCLRAEMVLSANTVRYPEFSEGVRALIIDKDKQPKWAFSRIEDVPEALVASFFEPPWPRNPLHDL
jgi:enoyl-CoA hydratase/carnithine racemase